MPFILNPFTDEFDYYQSTSGLTNYWQLSGNILSPTSTNYEILIGSANFYGDSNFNIRIGHNATLSGATHAIAFGTSAVAMGDSSTALGSGATANANYSTALGLNAYASNVNEINISNNDSTYGILNGNGGYSQLDISGGVANFAHNEITTSITSGSDSYEADINMLSGNASGRFSYFNTSSFDNYIAILGSANGYAGDFSNDLGMDVRIATRTHGILIDGAFSAPNGALQINQNGTPVLQFWADQQKLILGTGNSLPGIFDFDAYNSVGSDGASGFQFFVGNDPSSPGANVNALHIFAPLDATNARITVNNATDNGQDQLQVNGSYYGQDLIDDVRIRLNYTDGSTYWGILATQNGPDTQISGEFSDIDGNDVQLANRNNAIEVLVGATSLDGGNIITTGAGGSSFNGLMRIIGPGVSPSSGVGGEFYYDNSGNQLIIQTYDRDHSHFNPILFANSVTKIYNYSGPTLISNRTGTLPSDDSVSAAIVNGNIKSSAFVTSGGTSSQVVLGDGTLGTYTANSPVIFGTDRKTGLTAAQALAFVTVGGADATYMVSANVNVTTSTAFSFGVTCTYTDETNTSRVLNLSFSNLAGTFLQTITNVLGAGAYEGIPLHIRAKSGTTITIASSGTFTTVTYSFEERIVKL